MPPESRKFISDMLEAARAIEEFARGRDFPEFAGDKLLRSGVYYQFMIIGQIIQDKLQILRHELTMLLGE